VTALLAIPSCSSAGAAAAADDPYHHQQQPHHHPHDQQQQQQQQTVLASASLDRTVRIWSLGSLLGSSGGGGSGGGGSSSAQLAVLRGHGELGCAEQLKPVLLVGGVTQRCHALACLRIQPSSLNHPTDNNPQQTQTTTHKPIHNPPTNPQVTPSVPSSTNPPPPPPSSVAPATAASSCGTSRTAAAAPHAPPRSAWPAPAPSCCPLAFQPRAGPALPPWNPAVCSCWICAAVSRWLVWGAFGGVQAAVGGAGRSCALTRTATSWLSVRGAPRAHGTCGGSGVGVGVVRH